MKNWFKNLQGDTKTLMAFLAIATILIVLSQHFGW